MIEILLGGWENIRNHYAEEHKNAALQLRKVDCIGRINEEYFLPGTFKTKIEVISKPEFVVLQMMAMSQNDYDAKEAKQIQEHIQQEAKNYYFQMLRKNKNSDKFEMIFQQRTKAQIPLRTRQKWMQYVYELEQEKNINKNLDEYYKTIKPTIEFVKKLEGNLNVLLESHYQARSKERKEDEKVILYSPSTIEGLPNIGFYSDKSTQQVKDVKFVDVV